MFYIDGQVFTTLERLAYGANACNVCGDEIEPGDECKWAGDSLNCLDCYYDQLAETC